MKKHYKNIQLREDGFNAEYFDRRRRIAANRANGWTQTRINFERQEPILTNIAYLIFSFTPVALVAAYLWRLAK